MKKKLNNKNIILHDYFENYGGGERLVNILSKKFHILYFGFSQNKIVEKIINKKIDKRSLIKNSYPILFKKLITIIKFFFFKVPKCNNLVCSGNYSLFANFSNANFKIMYLHSIPKIFFKYKIFYKKNILLNIIVTIFKKLFKLLYFYKLNKFDVIIVNSFFTKRNIKKYIKKKINVIYPPIKKYKFKKINYKKYYISNSRHEYEKNIDKIILAFKKMPDKNIIITSNGSLTKQLKILAKKNKNIFFTGLISDKKYFNLIKNCQALINISNSEDFGMGAVEGMAYGKVNFFLNDGGYKEACKNNFNGILIKKKEIVNDLIYKINYFDIKKLIKLKKNCLNKSLQFNENIFIKKISNILK